MVRLGACISRGTTPETGSTVKGNLDPTKILIVSVYIGLWVAHYMLVHASNHPRYKDASRGKLNPVFVILLTEFVKLFVSAIILVTQSCWSKKEYGRFVSHAYTLELRPVVTLFKDYFPVAILYAVANNLMINNLQYFEPTVYIILTSCRLIMTSIIMWLLMGKIISRMKQVSILIITVGLWMEKASPPKSSSLDADSDSHLMTKLLPLALLILQMLCGAFASVYNEILLKKRQNEASNRITNINAANMCLCAESILLNGIAVMLLPRASMDHSSFKSNLDLVISSSLQIGIILTLALVGIVCSFLIYKVDSLSKSVASASTVLFNAIFDRIFFGYHISFTMACSAIFVSVGLHSFAFSNEQANDMNLKSVVLSLYRSLRQLWFIPIFFFQMAMFDS